MKLIWIIFIIIAVEEIIYNNIAKDKKQLAVYCFIVILSIVLCIDYYSNEYNKSLIGTINNKINIERLVWIK